MCGQLRTVTHALRGSDRVVLRDLRVAGAVMLAAGVVRGVSESSVGLPCPLRAVTGVPCPLCGMTTSVTAAVTGDLLGAVAANPAGLVAVVVAVVLVLAPRLKAVDLPRWAAPGGLALMWVWELFRFDVL